MQFLGYHPPQGPHEQPTAMGSYIHLGLLTERTSDKRRWVQLVCSEQAGQALSVYCPWLMPE